MPTFVMDTNVPRSNIPDTFVKEMSALMAKLMGKPETYICVQVKADQVMTFGGTTEPAAVCYLCCIGKLGLEENKSHTAALMEKINNDLHIPLNRMYIIFSDLERQNVGWNGTTFA